MSEKVFLGQAPKCRQGGEHEYWMIRDHDFNLTVYCVRCLYRPEWTNHRWLLRKLGAIGYRNYMATYRNFKNRLN